jgi:uncharacterized protein (DUF305 family)
MLMFWKDRAVMTVRTLLTVAAAGAAALAVTGCGSSSHSIRAATGASMPGVPMSATPTTASHAADAPATGSHSPADIAFAAAMIPHHQQAVQMADMALTAATSPQVKTLAGQIKAAQGPEITAMTGWLASWGQPASSSDAMGGMSHAAGTANNSGMGGGSGMGAGSGMMSDAEMTALGHATGTTFDRMWLQMMIRQHRGAIAMASTERTDGNNTAAVTLARSIIANQTAEITYMTTLLVVTPS